MGREKGLYFHAALIYQQGTSVCSWAQEGKGEKSLLIWGQLPVALFCRGGWLLRDLAHLCAGLVKLKLS